MNVNTQGLRFDEKGLIPAIVQDRLTGEVLMMAYMNQEALHKTLETGDVWFFSRSRQQLWHKGETSGNRMKLYEILKDCDQDTLLIKVVPMGPACHTGKRSCFYTPVLEGKTQLPAQIVNGLIQTIDKRYAERPDGSYTSYLFNSGLDKILKKVGEESAEVIIAAKNMNKSELIYETADLLYHLLVMIREQDITLEEVINELEKRKSKNNFGITSVI
jgi:phosphoribosyl-ATP pyrophosphohydrolase/phosphoribosyl-AMP cyclohydrolase